MKTLKTVCILALVFLIWGCPNSGLRLGTYESTGGSHFESITLKSGGKADMDFMGSIAEFDYSVEDGKLRLTYAGQTQLFTITEDGCLDGGGFMGKYCMD